MRRDNPTMPPLQPEKVVRAYFDAWNRHEAEALRATLEADVEWHRSADFPEGRILRGADALVDFAHSMRSRWSRDYRVGERGITLIEFRTIAPIPTRPTRRCRRRCPTP
jgi:ketosteroid isomerase-like protein